MNIIDNANCLTFDKETCNYRTFSIPVVISFLQLSTCESVFTVISISLLSRIACALAYLQIELFVSLFCLNIFFLNSYSLSVLITLQPTFVYGNSSPVHYTFMKDNFSSLSRISVV